MPIPFIIAAVAVAAAAAAASAGVKASKEQQIQGIWGNILEKYRTVGNYNPKYASANEFKIDPTLYQIPDDVKYQLINMSPEDKQRLLNAFRDTRDMAEKSTTSRTDLDRARVAMDAAQESSGAQQALLNDLSGRGAPGLEALIRGQSAQNSAQRNMLGGMTAAAQSGQERLGAQQLYGSQMQGLYDRDLSQAEKNAGIINQFNMTNAERKRQINERNIDLMNSYQQINNQSKIMQDQINRNNDRLRYEDKVNRIRDAERVTAAQTGSIRSEGEAVAGGISQVGNIAGSALSGYGNMGTTGTTGTTSPNYYMYGDDVQKSINKVGNYR